MAADALQALINLASLLTARFLIVSDSCGQGGGETRRWLQAMRC